MNFTTPSSFPDSEFRAFGIAAGNFFPPILSDEVLSDPLEKRTQFTWSWQAVRYRYRSCTECADEFKALLASPGPAWESGFGDEELTYRLERCIYVFFLSALSIFDSFAFCLYFLGNAVRPNSFPDVANPRKITLAATHKAMRAEFPHDPITAALDGLSKDARFATVDAVRNLLAHRLSGRRTMRTSSTRQLDGTFTRDLHEENWHIPGASQNLTFDCEMLHRQLTNVRALLTDLSGKARNFAETHLPKKPAP